MTLSCPDCGSPLEFEALTNGQSVCRCQGVQCRADFMTVGSSMGLAADKFVRKCEAHGYTVSLAAKLEAAERDMRDGAKQ